MHCPWGFVHRQVKTPRGHGSRRAVDLVNHDSGLAALLITGPGDVFTPRGERSGRHDDDPLGLGAAFGFDMLPFPSIRQSGAPVVSAVNGRSSGGALITAAPSDLAVASDQSTFRAHELLCSVADAVTSSVVVTPGRTEGSEAGRAHVHPPLCCLYVVGVAELKLPHSALEGRLRRSCTPRSQARGWG